MKKTDINLVPNTENLSPDYYCTWQTQLYACSNAGPQGQRDIMYEGALFGSGDEKEDIKNGIGWAYTQYKDARGDLYFILDDSWDVPIGAEPNIEHPEDDPWYGSLALARDKFPSFYGLKNAEPFPENEPLDPAACEGAMKRLSDKIKDLGWRGLGGWVCVQKAKILGYGLDENGNVTHKVLPDEEHWKRCLMRAYNAGWRYFKMDWGADDKSAKVRKTVTELAHKYAPEMWIEHAMVTDIIEQSDCFRSYDAYTLMAIPLTLSRLAELLMHETVDGYKGYINCEDEPYIAAALGCVLGVMRHGMTGNLPNGQPDSSFPALHRDFKHKTTEVLRAVRWHRIAPAIGVSGKNTFIDNKLLTNSWHIKNLKEEIEDWWGYKDGDSIECSAPARIARNIDPAEVKADENGDVPYVISSRFENVVSVATLGRTKGRSYFVPKCVIEQNIGTADTVGVFGFYKELILKSACNITDATIYMQDLASENAYDITSECFCKNGEIRIRGEMIERIGVESNPKGDTSEPGVIIKII